MADEDEDDDYIFDLLEDGDVEYRLERVAQFVLGKEAALKLVTVTNGRVEGYLFLGPNRSSGFVLRSELLKSFADCELCLSVEIVMPKPSQAQ